MLHCFFDLRLSEAAIKSLQIEKEREEASSRGGGGPGFHFNVVRFVQCVTVGFAKCIYCCSRCGRRWVAICSVSVAIVSYDETVLSSTIMQWGWMFHIAALDRQQ